MLEALYERVFKQARKERPVVTVHETPKKTARIVHGVDGYGEVEWYNNPPLQFSHDMNSLADFTAFLNSKHSGENGCVFVSEHSVLADLNYQEPGERECRLPLVCSEEFLALKEMEQGVGQKRLWALLVTKLTGCVEDALLLSIRNVAIHATKKGEVEIDNTGIASGGEGQHVTLSMPGGPAEEIQVDWTAKVRIWECFDKQYNIQLRLVIDTDEGLTFTFHRVRLDKVLRQARADLVHALREDVVFDVFDGSLGQKGEWRPSAAGSDIPL